MAVRAFTAQNVKNNKIMKKISLILSLLLVFSCNFQSGNDVEVIDVEVSQEFVQGSEDIPLLAGMEKVEDEGLGFDTSAGSIIATNYKSEIDLEKVQKFYVKTMPQLGWNIDQKTIGKVIFSRENENLEIEFVNQDGVDMVKFLISSGL